MHRSRQDLLALALLVCIPACSHLPPERGAWPDASCIAMDLDGVAWGSTIQRTWELAHERGWRCSLESSVRAHRFGMRCTDGEIEGASIFQLGFLRDALVSAALERSREGPTGECDPGEDFESWAGSELADLTARFGPSEATNPVEARGRVEAHRWQTGEGEIVLRVYPDARRISIEGVDLATLASLAIAPAEQLRLLAPTGDGISEMAVAEEVAHILYFLHGVEQSFYSEFGHYLAIAPYPPYPPRATYATWRPGEAPGFDDLGYAPTSGRSACSYGVSVGPPSCEATGDCGFTVAAACDRLGDGEIQYWALMVTRWGVPPPDGPFGVCRGGVYDPDTGRSLGRNVVGLCRPPPPE